MRREQLVMSHKLVQGVRRAMFASLAIVGLTIAASGFRFAQAQLHTDDLADRIRMQEKTLASMQEEIKGRKPESPPVGLQGKSVLSGLQSVIERTAKASKCTVNEFQAAPERTPYLSAFTLDTNRPEWEQISVHLTLYGTLAAALATVEGLRKADVIVEPDSIEIARQSISQQGVAYVSLRVSFRVLVKAGAPS